MPAFLIGCLGIRIKQAVIIAPGKKQKVKFKRSRPVLNLGTRNVRTMTPGLTASLQDINEARKTAVINNKLLRLQVGIAALQETLDKASSRRKTTPSSGKEKVQGIRSWICNQEHLEAFYFKIELVRVDLPLDYTRHHATQQRNYRLRKVCLWKNQRNFHQVGRTAKTSFPSSK